MTRNMTKIWLLGPGSGSWALKCDKNMKIIWITCGNNVKLRNHILFTFCAILFSYYFYILGPRPGSRPPKCENNMKIIWKTYENNVISQFHIIFTCYSYYFHIFITFLGSGPRSGPQKSYFCNIPGHKFSILFSYFYHIFWLGTQI